MQIELTHEMELVIAAEMQSGEYASVEAVVEKALNNMHAAASKQQDHAKRQQDLAEFFARLDADIAANGPIDFELERDLRPAEERDFF